MLKRLLRATLCFLVAFAGYWAYAFSVVPRIEPPPTQGPERDSGDTYVVTNRNLERFFPEGAWERDQPKVLESGQFFLLFRDYKPGEKNMMEVKPVTLLYFPEDDRDRRLPIIIQSPAGAIVESDRAINPARAIFGKPISARLPGRVEIRRARSSPDTDDELYVSTQFIQIDRDRIWTPHDVEFRFGPHHGRGKNLQIRLHSRDARGATLRKQAGVVRDIELAQVEKVYLTAGDGLVARSLSQSEAEPPKDEPVEENPPIEIVCDGTFRFDLVSQIASLTDNVRLTRKFSQFTDTLTCSLLEIHLRDTAAKPIERPSPSSNDEAPIASKKLAVDRLLARGSPVVLEAPSEQAYARAEYVECRYAERRIIVESKRGAWLRHQQTEMESQRLDYTLHPDDHRRPGVLLADGPGRIRGLSEGESGQVFEATWGKSLSLGPYEQYHALQLNTRATVQFGDMGGFSADKICLYLSETEQAPGTQPAPANDSSSSSSEATTRLRPDRLIATGNVLVDSPWLQSQEPSQELKVWFVPEAGVISETPPAGSSDGDSQEEQNDSSSNSGPSRPNGPPLEFQGEDIEVLVIDGHKYRLDEMTVGGRVRIARAPVKPGDEPLIISGDVLRIVGVGDDQAQVEVRGAPAEAGANGLLLRGASIVLDQGENMMTIPGTGEMRTTPRALPGKSSGAGSGIPAMLITWNEGLRFDGLIADFRGRVRVTGSSTFENGNVARFQIDGHNMQAELTSRLSFVKPPEDLSGNDVELATLTFPDDVMLENRTTTSRGDMHSIEHMEVRHLQLDQRTGDLTAKGPGHLSSIQRGSMVPGQVKPGDSAQSQLTNIQVHYQNAIQGNVIKREIEFQGRVHSLYGPVNSWDEPLDPDRGPLGKDAFELDSETLKLSEMPNLDRVTTHYELLARQDVRVRGDSFAATGETLHYDDGKSLLVLHGTQQEPASVQTNWQDGSGQARSFWIWHKAKRFKSEGVNEVQFGPFSNRQKPPPSGTKNR